MDVHLSEILEQRRKRAIRERDERREALYRSHPDLKALKEKEKALASRLVMETLSLHGLEEEASHAALKEELASIQKEEEALLQSLKLPADYDRVRYFCPDCQDTGFVNGKSCHCRDRLKLEELYRQSSIPAQLEEENFDHFNFDLFRKDRQEGEAVSPYDNMKEIVSQLREEYIPYFGPHSPSLYFFGPVGVGKTYLANSLAKALMEAGHTVYYRPAYDLLNFLSSYTFSHHKEDLQAERDFLFHCELLVIDDLGSEFVNNKSRSDLFELINSRGIAHRPSLISSNLAPDDLGKVYDERIESRIGGNYILYEFFGPDLRGRS